MSIALKPCPFCGSKEVTFYKFDADLDESDIVGNGFIWCPGCDFSSDTFDNEEIAAEKWNRRAEINAHD